MIPEPYKTLFFEGLRNAVKENGGKMVFEDTCVLYFRKREESRRFRPVWSYILLSFLFYIPVTVGAGAVPILGMLMLPKTVCYVLLILTFLLSVLKDGKAAESAGK